MWSVNFEWVESDDTYYAIRDNIDNYLGEFDEMYIEAFSQYLLPSEVDALF